VVRTDDGGLLAKVVLVRRNTDSLTDAIMAPVEAATTLLESLAQQAGSN
jgi:hypothetical protein